MRSSIAFPVFREKERICIDLKSGNLLGLRDGSPCKTLTSEPPLLA